MEIKVKQVVKYDGHQIMANGSVNLGLKASYSELTKTIELQQLLNNDVEIKCKLPDMKKSITLGRFRIKQTVVDGDGESKIKLNGLKDYIETDNLNLLPLNSDSVSEFVILYSADVDLENEEGDTE